MDETQGLQWGFAYCIRKCFGFVGVRGGVVILM
jgi:hypothetical protein